MDLLATGVVTITKIIESAAHSADVSGERPSIRRSSHGKPLLASVSVLVLMLEFQMSEVHNLASSSSR